MRLSKIEWIRLVFSGLALPLALPVLAQPADDGPERDRPEARRDAQRPPDRPGFGRAQGFRPTGADPLARLMAVLTPEQRSSVREMMADNREKAIAREKKIAEARKELMETSLEGNFNEEAVRKQARIIAELETERMVATAKTLAKIDPPLTPEQKRELRQAGAQRPPMDRFGPRERPQDRPGTHDRPRYPERRRDRQPPQPE